jgi:hypothetical protein
MIVCKLDSQTMNAILTISYIYEFSDSIHSLQIQNNGIQIKMSVGTEIAL